MLINANGIDREATPQEILEIETINATAYDISKEIADRELAKKTVADKLGLTVDELKALLA